MQRPGWDEYFMNIAHQAARRSNCSRRQVGAVIVKQRAIISTGYNGTPIGVKNCFEGGCPRCQSETPSFQDYDNCLCVHAEENAIILAARQGTATNNGILYTTLRPCFGCVKAAIQAGIKEIIYDEYFGYAHELEQTYCDLIQEANLVMRQYHV